MRTCFLRMFGWLQRCIGEGQGSLTNMWLLFVEGGGRSAVFALERGAGAEEKAIKSALDFLAKR